MKFLLTLLLLVSSVFGQTTFSSGIKTPFVVETAKDIRQRKLSSFQLRRTMTALTGVTNGVSGVTYNARSGTLFVIRNASGASSHIYEVAVDGTVLRTITESATAGEWVDTEAISWIGYDVTTASDVFLIAEEENPTNTLEGRLSLVKLTPAATTLTRTAAGNASTTTAYTGGTINNLGIEAIAYDPTNDKIYYTSEKKTQLSSDNTAYASGPGQWRIFQRSITWKTGTLSFGAESVLCSILPIEAGAPATDISDMCYDISTDTLLLHSDESDKVIRINKKTGAIIEQLAAPMNQPEGVAIHPSGLELYLTGENQEYQLWSVGSYMGQPWRSIRSGVVTLAAGVATVADTQTTANTKIFVQRQTDGGTIGDSYSISRTAGTSFTITTKLNSANHTTDTSVMAWIAFEP